MTPSQMPADFCSVWMRMSKAPLSQAQELAKTLERKYNCYGRHFHNWEHIQFVVQQLQLFADKGVSPLELDEAIVAAYFHDVVNGSELQSMLLFRDYVYRDDVSQESTSRIEEAILETHQHKPASPVGKMLCDADMSILAADWPTFQLYELAIRLEYDMAANPEVFKRKRAFFLEQTLNSTIFHTDLFSTMHEEKAKDNIRRLLKEAYG